MTIYTHAISFTVAAGMNWEVGVQTDQTTFATTGTITFNTMVQPTAANGVLATVQNSAPFYNTGYGTFAACENSSVENNLITQEVGVAHVLRASTESSFFTWNANFAQAVHMTFLFPVPTPGIFQPYLEVYDLSFTPMTTGSEYGAPYSFKVTVFESSTNYSIYQVTNTGGGSYAGDDQLWTITRTVNTWGNMTDFTLLATHHAKRVRLDITGTDNATLFVGKLDEAWPTGCWIEVVNNGNGQLVACSPVVGATLNSLSGTNTLLQGESARFYRVNSTTWDMHVYPSTTRISGLKLDDLYDVNTSGSATNYTLVKTALGEWSTTPLPEQTVALKSPPLTTVTTPNTIIEVGSSLQHNHHYRCTSAVTVTVRVKLDSTFTGSQEYWENNFAPDFPAPMPIGGTILIGKHGAGNVIFEPDSGVIINTPDTLTISNIHGKATLIKVAANEWDLEGNIGA